MAEVKALSMTRCPHCQANMKKHNHRLTPGLLAILIKAIKFVKKKDLNFFHPDKDLNLLRIEYSNFQKLRFHGLIAKSGTIGYWVITKKDGKFLRGECKTASAVITYRNRIDSYSKEKIHIKEMIGMFPEFQKDFNL